MRLVNIVCGVCERLKFAGLGREFSRDRTQPIQSTFSESLLRDLLQLSVIFCDLL
jgi:hypothetical protein